jgi:hypothetical protein
MLSNLSSSVWRAFSRFASTLMPSDMVPDVRLRDPMSVTPHDVLRLAFPASHAPFQETSK